MRSRGLGRVRKTHDPGDTCAIEEPAVKARERLARRLVVGEHDAETAAGAPRSACPPYLRCRDAEIMGRRPRKHGRFGRSVPTGVARDLCCRVAMLASFRTIAGLGVLLLAACSDEDEVEPGTDCERVVQELGACMTERMKDSYVGVCRGAKAFSASCRLRGCRCEGSSFLCAPDTCAPD